MTWVRFEDMVSLREQGHSYDSIASQLDCSIELVRNMMKKNRPDLMNIGGGQYTKIDMKLSDVVYLRRHGWTKNQIATVYGCCGDTIKTRLKIHQEETGESLSGWIQQSLMYPDQSIKRLKSKGLTVLGYARNENVSVLDVIKRLIVIEQRGRK